MLTELEMICVQFVSVKIMTIAYATVTSQVTQILFFFLYFRNIILFKVFHIFLGFKCQVSVKIRFQLSGVRCQGHYWTAPEYEDEDEDK